MIGPPHEHAYPFVVDRVAIGNYQVEASLISFLKSMPVEIAIGEHLGGNACMHSHASVDII